MEVVLGLARPGDGPYDDRDGRLVEVEQRMNRASALTDLARVDVPQDCALEVGGETRSWEPGRLSIFDDTYRHAAWNRSDRPRRVLLCDFWSPDLSAVERVQLKRALPLLFTPSRDANTVSPE